MGLSLTRRARLRRGTPWGASTIVHAALLALVVWCAGGRGASTRDGATEIEMIDVATINGAPPPSMRAEAAAGDAGARGAASSPRSASSPQPASRSIARASRRATPMAAAPPPIVREEGTVPVDGVRPAAIGAGSIADIGFVAPPSGATGGAGAGDARGDGRGRGGVGDGTGGGGRGGAGDDAPRPASTPRAAPSKARPARLLWPTREVEEQPEWTFIALVTVDDDGEVDGARLLHGVGGPRDDAAISAVWRFHYAPALDDDGRPIRSKVEQTFVFR